MDEIADDIDRMIEALHMEILVLIKLTEAIQEKTKGVAQAVLDLEQKLDT